MDKNINEVVEKIRNKIFKSLFKEEDGDVYFLVSVEIEFYIKSKDNETIKIDSQQIIDLKKAIQELGKKNKIKIEDIEKEDGINQFEIQTEPTDNIQNLCNFIASMQKEEFEKTHNITLDSKPLDNQPGSAIHFHISLYDCNDISLFGPINQNKTNSYQQSFYWAIGGCMSQMPQSMSIFAPTENCYKRFNLNYKTTIFKHHPTTYSWGVNNRTCAIRIPKSITVLPADTRIEHRVCSTKINPYEAIPLILSSIGYGICNKINPPEQTFGDAFDPIYTNLERLPISLAESKTISKDFTKLLSWIHN